MKRCPECRRDYYDDSLLYCLDDGAALLEGPASLEPVTKIIDSPDSAKGGRETEEATRIYSDSLPISVEIRRHRFGVSVAIVAGIILLSGFGYGIYKLLEKSGPVQPPRSSAAITTRRLTGDGKARGAEISPDGKFLAYIRTEGGERSIWLKQIQTNSNIQVVKPGDLDRFDGLKFSPDGGYLYFNAEIRSDEQPSVYRVPTLGGTPTKFLANAFRIRFSPDGSRISFGRDELASKETSVWIANADGTGERRLAARSLPQFYLQPTAWSPDGKFVSAIAGDDAIAQSSSMPIVNISTTDGKITEIGKERWSDVDDIAWHPSGDSLIVAGTATGTGLGQIYEVSYPSGDLRRLTNNLNGHYSVSVTADGKSIVTGEIYSRSALWVSPDLKPENAKPVMPDNGDTWGFDWTPDGRLVYVSDQTGDAEVWIMDADGSNAKPLTSDKVFKTTPVVSPDGRYIVYTAIEDGPNTGLSGSGGLIRIDINGGNPLTLVTKSGADNPHVSNDGKWVIFSAYDSDGPMKVMRVPIDGGKSETLTTHWAKEPRYSRDGSRFACFLLDEKTLRPRLAIVPAEGGDPVKVFDVPSNTSTNRGPVWTPDDKGITLIVAPGEQQNIWLQPVDGGDPKPMTNFDQPGVARREYSRDGKRIAIVRAQGVGNAIMITDFR